MRTCSAIRSALALVVLCAAAGCGSHVRYFRVTSYPEGATVYVDGEDRGQTTFSRLEVDFGSEDQLITLRLEKPGYQPTGTVISRNSPAVLAFFLEEAPQNREILETLKGILKVLDRLSSDFEDRRKEVLQ
jgi:hypothetical protein